MMAKRKEKIGTPPGSLIYVGKKKCSTLKINLYIYTKDQYLEKKIDTIEEAFPFLDQPTLTWIKISGIDPELVEKLGKQLHWHLLVQEDILFTGQRPKIDDYDTYLYIVLRRLFINPQTNHVEDEQVSIVFGKNYLITFSESEVPFLDQITKQLGKEGSLLRQQGSDYLAYSVIDAIIDHYFVVIEELDDQLEKIENQLLKLPQPYVLQNVLKKKREVITIRKHIWPMREVVRSFQANQSTLIHSVTKVFLSDAYDHTIQAIETVEGLRDITDDMVEIHLSNANQRLNQIMTLLTIIATIFVPLTFIASIYGMNFRYMPELDWVWGYPVVLTLMLTLASSMLFYFYKKGWL